MADPLSLAVLSASITGLLMRGAAVAVDPSWSSAASLPNDVLNAWRSLRRLQQGRGGQENPLEASIKARLQKQVDDASERYERTSVTQSALAGAVTEMEVALTELSGDDAAVIKAVRFPDNFEIYLRRRTADRRQNVEAAAESFFDDLTRIVADEFTYRAPGSRAFDIAALKQLLAGQEQIRAGVEQLQGAQAKTNERLSAVATDIKEIHSAVTQHQSALPKRIRSIVRPTVTAGFIEREGQDELFDAIFTRAEPRTVLTGMRGSGKTQLAATVAAKCEDEGWPIVAWINAASHEELISDLHKLTQQVDTKTTSDDTPKKIVERWLNDLSSADAEDRLFVFDNVENFDDITDVTPRGEGIRVLTTTTRRLAWDTLGWQAITVDVFRRKQSIALLCEHTSQNEHGIAGQIAEALGDLPVAIIQAASAIRRGRFTLSEYLSKLSNSTLDRSMNRREGGNYREAVAVALFMAYEQALEYAHQHSTSGGQIASQIMSTISLLSASGVPTHWLRSINNGSEDTREALASLLEYSVCQESNDRSTISLHRLQSQVFREEHLNSNTQQLQEACDNIVTLLTSVIKSSSSNVKQGGRDVTLLVSQLETIASQSYSQCLFQNTRIVNLIEAIIKRLGAEDVNLLPYGLISPVNKAIEALAPENTDCLGLRRSLAVLFSDMMDHQESLTLTEEWYFDHIKFLGPNHKTTLSALNILAEEYCWLGYAHKAITLFKIALPRFEEILGNDHPFTLSAREHLKLSSETNRSKVAK